MKKPLLNLEQRRDIRFKTFYGASLELHLAISHLRRDVYKTDGYFAMKTVEKQLNKLLTKALIRTPIK
ncbi:MAG: hypothetical protein ACUZ8H_15695 [Candidatus Anammoxibacter sp.]